MDQIQERITFFQKQDRLSLFADSRGNSVYAWGIYADHDGSGESWSTSPMWSNSHFADDLLFAFYFETIF